MDEKFTTLEVIAPSIDEAISKGLSDLGVPREMVEIEILDEGNKGFLGLGNRQARVRLTVVNEADGTSLQLVGSPGGVDTVPENRDHADPTTPAREVVEEVEDEVLDIARETVNELLDKMKIRAKVSAHYGEDEDGRGSRPVLVDVHGQDLSILIGSKAATLNALQYITRLIVSKELGKSILLIVDVEGYRERRKRQLQRLARRMAEQAVSTGKRQILEPMPANERRIIHIELRDDPEVSTESIGEEPRRKITINPRE